MSLRAQQEFTVPAETARVARAAFPRGNPYVRLSDTLGPIFSISQFVACVHRKVSLPKIRSASPWSRSFSSLKVSPFGKRPMLSGAVSIGSMLCSCLWRMPASMPVS